MIQRIVKLATIGPRPRATACHLGNRRDSRWPSTTGSTTIQQSFQPSSSTLTDTHCRSASQRTTGTTNGEKIVAEVVKLKE